MKLKNVNTKLIWRIVAGMHILVLCIVVIKYIVPKIRFEHYESVTKIEIIKSKIISINKEIMIINDEEADNDVIIETVTSNSYCPLTDEERHIVECLVAGEAGGESLEGQMAVAQCILNATIRSNISISEVKSTYGYAGWSNSPENYPTVAQAVSAVFDSGEVVTDEFILWFYNPAYGYSSFHESQKFVIEIGGHRFFAPWD